MEITRRAVISELSCNGMRPWDIMSATFMMSRLLTAYSGHGPIDCRYFVARGPMLRNGELKFWTPVNFEVEYFLNEETESVLTDSVIIFLWPATSFAISTQT